MKSKVQKKPEPSNPLFKGRIWAGWGWLYNYVPRSRLVREARYKAGKRSRRLLCNYDGLLRIELFTMGIIGGWATAMGIHQLESKYPKETKIIDREINEALKEKKKAGKKDPLYMAWYRKMTGWEGGMSEKDIREMKGETKEDKQNIRWAGGKKKVAGILNKKSKRGGK